MKPWSLPFTRFGFGLSAITFAAMSIGWLAGWTELVVVGGGGLIALLLAIPYVVGGHPLVLERTLNPERVEVGGTAESVLTISNRSTSASGQRILRDVIGEHQVIDTVPYIDGDSSTRLVRPLPTAARGVLRVGPAVLAKADPLGLMARDLGRTGVDELRVHPKVIPLASMQAGFAKDLDGPTYDSSPAGNVAFHAIREYQLGDDVRHIHWMSTARTGTTMVRHYVDNRRPFLAVIVDGHPGRMTGDAFERGLEVAASQLVSAARDGRPIAIWVGDQQVMTGRHPTSTNGALDRLSESAQATASPDLAVLVDRARKTDPDISATLIVTGSIKANALLPAVTVADRQGRVIICRFVDGDAKPTAVPRAKVFDCRSIDEFEGRWKYLVR